MNPYVRETAGPNSTSNDERVIVVHTKQLSLHTSVKELALNTKGLCTVQVRHNIYFFKFTDRALAAEFKVS